MPKTEQTWLGELGEQEWRLELSAKHALQRIAENSDVPYRDGGPAFSSGRIVSHFEEHGRFWLRVTTLFRGRTSIGIPRLVGRVKPADDGSVLTFRIELAYAMLVWVPPLLMAGVMLAGSLSIVAWITLRAEEEAANQAAFGMLLCLALPAAVPALASALMVLRARSMSTRLLREVTGMFEDVRVPEVLAAPPER